jgi:cytochrome b6-f complex iron-sulfur subunit
MKKEIKQAKQEGFPTDPMQIQNRREFLNKIWKTLGGIAAAEIVFVFFGFLFSGKKESKKPEQLFDAGNVSQYNNGSVTIFRGGRFYLARLNDGGFIALSIRCSHLGCSVNWEEDKERFICPCHASSFDITGDVNTPPAPSALDYFPVKIQNGRVMVDTGTKHKRDRFSKEQAAYI